MGQQTDTPCPESTLGLEIGSSVRTVGSVPVTYTSDMTETFQCPRQVTSVLFLVFRLKKHAIRVAWKSWSNVNMSSPIMAQPPM